MKAQLDLASRTLARYCLKQGRLPGSTGQDSAPQRPAATSQTGAGYAEDCRQRPYGDSIDRGRWAPVAGQTFVTEQQATEKVALARIIVTIADSTANSSATTLSRAAGVRTGSGANSKFTIKSATFRQGRPLKPAFDPAGEAHAEARNWGYSSRLTALTGQYGRLRWCASWRCLLTQRS